MSPYPVQLRDLMHPGNLYRLRTLALAGFCVLMTACVRQALPTGSRVIADVSVEPLPADVSSDELLAGLATVASAKFLGIWDGVVFEYALYDPELLHKDLQRIRRYLRARGYYESLVVAARVIQVDSHRVNVVVRVTPGPPVLVNRIEVPGLEQLPLEVGSELLARTRLKSGEVFDEARYEATKQGFRSALLDAGYAFAEVDGSARVDLAAHRADVSLTVKSGPSTTYGAVEIVGARTVPEDKLRELAAIKRGEPYSKQYLDDVRRELSELGLFSRVEVAADLARVQDNQVPVIIRVEESPPRLVRIGAGAELDALKLANYGVFGWSHRNFFGGLRKMEANTRPALVYFPTRWGSFAAPNRVLFQNELKLALEQPAFLERLTHGLLSAEFNVYPLLFAQSGADEGLIGFAEVKASAGLSRKLWHQRVILAPSYNWQLALPFDYQALSVGKQASALDEELNDLAIATAELSVYLDLRDDPLNTHRGAFFAVNLQTAQRALGGDIRDARVKPEARLYVPISKSVVLAQRLTFGLLAPFDYGSSFNKPADDKTITRDQQKLLFRGFFSGGANSNRGYPLRAAGPHGPVPFLVGERPLGGTTLWESSTELRIDLIGGLGVALFVDASNVGRRPAIDFSSPHLSPGMGMRYRTPIGPFRLDLGYRVPGAQVSGSSANEPNPSELLGVPLALHLSLGEAF